MLPQVRSKAMSRLSKTPNEERLYVVENIPTGIEDDEIGTENAVPDGPVLNLAGLRVADSLTGIAPGVYVVQGKKVIIRE